MFGKHTEPSLGSRSAEPSGADYAVPDGDADPLLLESRLHAAALLPALAGAVGSVAIAAAGVALLAHSSAPTVVRAAFDLVLVALGIRFVVAAVRSTWRWERSALRVTARELVLRQRPHEMRLLLARVRELRVKQSLAGRLFGYGTLIIDDGNRERRIRCVPDPELVRSLIERARS